MRARNEQHFKKLLTPNPHMNTVTSHDGTRIAYDRHGTGNPLIFIHGAGGDSTVWKNIRTDLHKEGHSTLALDLRGHGYSDRPDRYSLQDYAKDVEAVIKKERVKKYTLIGHSFGTAVAMTHHTIRNANKYVLISATDKMPLLLKLTSFPNLITQHLPSRTKKQHVNYDQFKGTQDLNLKRLASDLKHTSLKSWIATYHSLNEFQLPEITQPTLLIHGKNDSIYPLKNAQRLKEKIPHATLKIIDGNHIPVINNQKTISKTIQQFLRE